MMGYNGYKLLDKIILVCKEPSDREDSIGDVSSLTRAYLVDPKSTKQLESARRWAKWTEYGPSYRNEETGKWENEYVIEHEPIEYEFDNNGFGFKLKDCAGGSSQGGKLSFWNCIVSKDDKEFLIGINSEMLLNVLLEGTFINGKLDGTVSFATKKGSCGVVVEGGESYKLAMKDMNYKSVISKNKTTKYKSGDNVTTISIDDWYLGEFYRYYEFIPKFDGSYWKMYSSIVWNSCVLRKLKKPKKLYAYVFRGSYSCRNVSKLSDCLDVIRYNFIEFKDTKPQRCIGDNPLNMDIELNEFGKIFSNEYTNSIQKLDGRYYTSQEPSVSELLYRMLTNDCFGVSVEDFELSSDIIEKLKILGVKYEEE